MAKQLCSGFLRFNTDTSDGVLRKVKTNYKIASVGFKFNAFWWSMRWIETCCYDGWGGLKPLSAWRAVKSKHTEIKVVTIVLRIAIPSRIVHAVGVVKGSFIKWNVCPKWPLYMLNVDFFDVAEMNREEEFIINSIRWQRDWWRFLFLFTKIGINK